MDKSLSHDVPAALRPGCASPSINVENNEIPTSTDEGPRQHQANFQQNERQNTGQNTDLHQEQVSNSPEKSTIGITRKPTNPFLRKPVPNSSALLSSQPLPSNVRIEGGRADNESLQQLDGLNPSRTGTNGNTTTDFQEVWERLDKNDKDINAASKVPPIDGSGSENWSIVDPSPSHTPGRVNVTEPEETGEQPPLPPRPPPEESRLASPRLVDPKTETYKVKKIQWRDKTNVEDIRTSPILVQNNNGPCPLLALVNALSLTTPPAVSDAPLVEVLRTREQISLSLLLDAVLEELMSPRRIEDNDELPDISDLYSFLQSLHTGMNVNPRFVPIQVDLLDDSPNVTAGTFEKTPEMELYSTFKIPLIHGWLPQTSISIHDAFQRQAGSYEDVQRLLFQEEELEQKLSSDSGLSQAEQQMYQDVILIKEFLESSPTQLTTWGIEVMSKFIPPGSFAILFRNDHFSTLYCHPQTKQLLTLVTDDGYRAHNQVVWETLVDTSGEQTQYLSGDFAVLSFDTPATPRIIGEFPSGAQGEREASQYQETGVVSAQAEPPLTRTEQEDRDLAYAIQLQEEEDVRHRERQQQRNNQNSSQTNGHRQQGRQPSGIPPQRRTSTIVASSSINSRPPWTLNTQQPPSLIPPRGTTGASTETRSGPVAPPSYEQAANADPYEPPPGHPSHPSSSASTPRTTGVVSGTSTTSNLRTSQAQGQRIPGQSAGMRVSGTSAPSKQRNKDCVLM